MLQVTGKRPETISLKARPEGVFVLGDHRNELQEAGIDLESDSRILVRDACTREIRWDPFNMEFLNRRFLLARIGTSGSESVRSPVRSITSGDAARVEVAFLSVACMSMYGESKILGPLTFYCRGLGSFLGRFLRLSFLHYKRGVVD